MTTERLGVRENLEDFINIYRSEPCIWQIKAKDYHNRDKKQAAYGKLIEQLKIIEPNANRDLVVKKINGLRTNYRKEKKKVEESTRSGAGTNDVYEPTLWYYDLMKFLDDDQAKPRSSHSNIDENDSSQENEPESMENDFLPSQHRSDNSPGTSSTTVQTSSHPRPPKRKSMTCSSDIDLSHEVLRSVNDHFKRPLLKDDRFDIFGKNVAMKLRDLPKQQRLIAEKNINDTLFQAEMGTLTFPERHLYEHEFIRATSTCSPATYEPQQLIRANPTPSPTTHQPQQFILSNPTPKSATHQPQQLIRAILTPRCETHQPQQLIPLMPTPSPSNSVPENQQEYDYYSSPSSVQYNSESQHSIEDVVQLSIQEQSVGAFVSNYNDIQ